MTEHYKDNNALERQLSNSTTPCIMPSKWFRAQETKQMERSSILGSWVMNRAYVKSGSRAMHSNSLCKKCGVFGANNAAGTCYRKECK